MDKSQTQAPPATTGNLTLKTRRTIAASAARLYEAWTDPEQLCLWWGPRDVRCIDAHIDLRVGGHYRIGNQLADGRIVWIGGTFETIEPGRLLAYSWSVDGQQGRERVTVRFEPRDDATEVVVVHERIASQAVRADHENGWKGCLQGLEEFARRSPVADRWSD